MKERFFNVSRVFVHVSLFLFGEISSAFRLDRIKEVSEVETGTHYFLRLYCNFDHARVLYSLIMSVCVFAEANGTLGLEKGEQVTLRPVAY